MAHSPQGQALDQFLRQQYDVLQYLRDNFDAIQRVANHLSPVEDLVDFKEQVEALYAKLGLLVEASEIMILASEAGIALLHAESVPLQRAALGLGTAALRSEEFFATASGFSTLQTQVNDLSAVVDSILVTLQNTATSAELEALAARVDELEDVSGFNARIDSLILDLINGTYTAALQSHVDQLTLTVTNLGDEAYLHLQRTDLMEVGLANLTTGQDALASALDETNIRVTATEDGIALVVSDITALDARVTNAEGTIDSHGSAIETLSTSVEDLETSQTITAGKVTNLEAGFTDLELGLEAEATAREALEARVEVTEDGIEILSTSINEVTAALSAAGNLLPNAAFEVDTRQWELFSIGAGWDAAAIDSNKVLTPLYMQMVKALRLRNTGVGTPAESAGVRSVNIPVLESHYIVSGYLAGVNCTARLEYRWLNEDGDQIGYGLVGSSSDGPVANLRLWPRIHAKIAAPVGAALLQVQLWAVNCTGVPSAWLLHPMVEEPVEGQTLPSKWVNSVGGIEEALAGATSTLAARVTDTETGIEAASEAITDLESTVYDPETGLPATAAATMALTTQVTLMDGEITGLLAQYVLDLDVDGRVVGWKFSNDGTTGIFDIVADQMRITAPEGFKSVEFIDGILSSKSATHTRYMGVDFGAVDSFIDWYGPTPIGGVDNASDVNGIFWIKKDGSAYFGGNLAEAGVLAHSSGDGVNRLPDQYSSFETGTLPAMASFSNVGLSLVADADTIGGYYLRAVPSSPITSSCWFFLSKNGSFDRNIKAEPGDYLLSYYAYANVDGHLIRFIANHAAGSVNGVNTALTTTRTRYTQKFTLPAGVTKINLSVFTNMSGMLSRQVYFDGFMLERLVGHQEVPSPYARGIANEQALDAAANAAAAQTVADAAAVDAAVSLNTLSDIASDTIVTPNEKIKSRVEYNELTGEYGGIVAQAVNYGVVTHKTAYVAAMAALQTYLNGLGLVGAGPGYAWTSITGNTTIVSATWNTKWQDVYITRQTLLNTIVTRTGGAGANMLSNTEFAYGATSWGNAQPVVKAAESYRMQTVALASAASVFPYQDVAYSLINGSVFSASVEVGWGGTTNGVAVASLTIQFYNAGGLISQKGSEAVYPGSESVWTMPLSVSGAVMPVGTTYVRWILQLTGQAVWFFRKPKLERSMVPSPYTQGADGFYGNELTYAGSLKQIGDLRNINPTGHANVGSAWISGALSFTAAAGSPATATISMSAATLRLAGVDIAYSAASVGVTGTNGTSVTYLMYFDDSTFSGGARTLGATTSYNTLINSLNRVFIGSVTVVFPASGSGGGGGGMNNCPAQDAWVICRGLDNHEIYVPAGEVRVGDFLKLTNGNWGLVTHSEPAYVPCVRVQCENPHARLTCSTTARLGLAGDGDVMSGEAQGMHLRVRYADPQQVDQVTGVEDVGSQWVQHITCEDDFFWAGDEIGYLLAHHNLKA